MGRLTSTILLVAALAGLGAYIYFVDADRPVTGSSDREKVFTVEADTLQEITLTSEGETTTLRKADGSWRLTSPVQAEADQSEISSLTSALETLEMTRVVDENAANLADYGLATPRITLAFSGEGGASGQLHIGDKSPTQSDVYAVKPGESRVFLIPAFNETTFAKKSFDLRDKRVLHFERDKVDTIELTHDAATVQLARSGSDWTVKSPVTARGDYSAIEGLLTRISGGSMTRLVDGGAADAASLARYGLDKPSARVTLGAGSTRATLAVGKEEDGATYAHDVNRNIVFTIDSSLAADLRKPADEFRDKDLFEFRGFNASRLRIARGDETLEFQKVSGGEGGGDKWQRVSGSSTTDVDAGRMDDLLTKLTGLRAQSFVPNSATTGLDKPSLVVSVSYDEGKFERVRLARTSEAFASRDGEPGAAKLDASAFDETLKALDAVLAPPPPPAALGNSTPTNATPGAPPQGPAR